MSIVEYFVKQVKSYFLNSNLVRITGITVITIYAIFLIIELYIPNDSLLFIYWNLIYSFLIYFSTFLIIKKYLYITYRNNFHNIQKTIKIIIFITTIKLVWNALYIIILDSNYISNNIYKTFYPLILIFISWLYIYFAATFYVPHIYFGGNNKIKFHNYIQKNWQNLILNIIITTITSLLIIYILTNIFNIITHYISYLKNPQIHKNIEICINITLKILFSHMLSVMAFNTYFMQYKQKNIK